MVNNHQSFQRENRIKLLAQEWKALGCIELKGDALEEWIYEIQAKYGVTRRLAIDYIEVAKTMAKIWIREEKAQQQASNEVIKEIKQVIENDMPKV